jgi:GMP synthase (glutamine-hydrolysing)
MYCYGRVVRAFDARSFDFLRLDAWRLGFPDDVALWARTENIRGIVFDGACQSPIDPFEWIRREEEFVRRLVPLGIPTLGICFGHEVFASALGGEIAARDNYEVAMHDIEAMKDDPLLEGLSPACRMPVAHRVEVTRMPPGFELIATSAYSPIQVMRHETLPVYGVQFHPEADPGIKPHDPDWNCIDDEDFGTSDGDRLLANFSRIVKEKRA